MALTIGPLVLDNPVLLAPMSGVTDLPFRRIARRFGAGLAYSEMIASAEMVRETRGSLRRAASSAETGPMAVQLAGTEPEVMAEAAKLVEGMGAALIDINFGCPAKKVVKRAAGSALMREEGLAVAIVGAVVRAVACPVTVKMRTGWDDNARNAPKLAKMAEGEGARLITVHGRTRCQFYSGRADWHFIAEVKAAVGIPVVANGDIASAADASDCLAVSGADGVMVGRAAQGRPWLPGAIARALAGNGEAAEPDMASRWALAREHLDAMLVHYGTDRGLRIARKHLGWYAQGLPGAATFRNAVNNATEPTVVIGEIRRFFAPAGERMAA
ncbi:MAG: tRNA dihydrouridine synthase DusB [Alphaproteobacteria bacterium]|nr:tRNA dihydrouridine synthase DusB [Alphaproteobacteria bacterium]